jgi:DNA primase
MIPKNTVDDIIAAAQVEEVVGDFVTLKKRGSNLMGLCPFHGEKTPSFVVSPGKGIYKCFGCGRAGNSVGFVMEHEKMEYVDALRYLARKYNIEIVEERNQTPEAVAAAGERESLLIALEYAAKQFETNLWEDEEGKTVGRSYFYERGFRDETIKKFGLGYTKKEWGSFTDHAVKIGYSMDVLQKAGLSKVNDQGRAFDMFRERVMFPFHNLSGRVVAFGGRQLVKDDKSPKYLNSPETEVYKKSEILYGIYFAKNSIRQHDKCYLVEGYTDVITLSQAGVENVAASSGTSLTEGQVKQIYRFTKNVCIIYDGDAAGMKAALRGIDVVLAGGLNVKIVLLPEGEDPDTFCKTLGGTAFQKYLDDNEKDFILYKSELLVGEAKNDPVKKAAAIRDIVESISKITDSITRSTFINECSRVFDVGPELLMAEVNKIRRKGDVKDPDERRLLNELEQITAEPFWETETQPALNMGVEQEKGVARVLMQFGHLPYRDTVLTVNDYVLQQIDADGFEFEHPLYKKVLETVKTAIEEMEPIDENFFIKQQDQEMVSLAADFLTEKYKISPHWEEKFEIYITEIKDNYANDVDSVMLHLKLKKLDVLMQQNLDEMRRTEEDTPQVVVEEQTVFDEAEEGFNWDEADEMSAEHIEEEKNEETPTEPEVDNDESTQKMEQLLQKHMMFLNYRKQITELIGTTVVK